MCVHLLPASSSSFGLVPSKGHSAQHRGRNFGIIIFTGLPIFLRFLFHYAIKLPELVNFRCISCKLRFFVPLFVLFQSLANVTYKNALTYISAVKNLVGDFLRCTHERASGFGRRAARLSKSAGRPSRVCACPRFSFYLARAFIANSCKLRPWSHRLLLLCF